ncbi:hypothetical protein SISNIDRAFT_537784 [Sistotremastrum niveocremeum HHB9708]|uniref:HTH TFE/IIEalpha-type domain-containing protein n=1 Tax=Sistotremastrum niveocremeum HHB9708 TaxID=1314777 RepID=A0A164N0Y4_9AGAM|nr:hypothetical protein SISNIDRAFT_537784 [Sistotremastrum niveocremeum HHB9708]
MASARENQDNMATLRLLVQQVSRSFYEPKYIVVMDQLARHPVIKDDDLAGRIGLQAKELNKLTAVLVNDKLVKVYRRNELKEGALRAVGRQYYYIDYKHFCDVVKWRVAQMRELIDKDLRNELDTKGYICPQCGTSYASLDVDRLLDMATGTFLCEICRTEVVDNENAESLKGSQDRMQRFNKAMTWIREGLRKSEEMVLPAFDVHAWVQANTTEAEKQAMDAGDGLMIAGGGPAFEDRIGVVMSIDKDEATRKAEREQEAAAKRQQNQMPSWHTKSTISGDLTALGIAQANALEKESANSHILDSLASSSKSLSSLSGDTETKPNIGSAMASTSFEAPVDVKPVIDERQADYYDQYYAQLEAKPEGRSEGSWDGSDEEEGSKSYFGQNGKRSRSQESDQEDERPGKVAKTNGESSRESSSGSGLFGAGVDTPDGDGAGKTKLEDDPMVSVNGVEVPFSQITDEHEEAMTPDEYTALFALIQVRGLPGS